MLLLIKVHLLSLPPPPSLPLPLHPFICLPLLSLSQPSLSPKCMFSLTPVIQSRAVFHRRQDIDIPHSPVPSTKKKSLRCSCISYHHISSDLIRMVNTLWNFETNAIKGVYLNGAACNFQLHDLAFSPPPPPNSASLWDETSNIILLP